MKNQRGFPSGAIQRARQFRKGMHALWQIQMRNNY